MQMQDRATRCGRPQQHRSDKLEKKPRNKRTYIIKKSNPPCWPRTHRATASSRIPALAPSSHDVLYILRQSMQNLTMAQLSRAVPVNTRHVRLHNSHNSEMRNPSSITPWLISTSPSRGSRGQYCCRAYSVHRLCGVIRAYPACWQLLDAMLARSSRTEYSVGCSACAAFSHY